VGSGGSVVQMRCGHEMRQREGAWRTRRQIGVGCHGAGMSGREGRTCTHARGGSRLGKETGAWDAFHGCGLVALGRPEGIVLFFIYSKTFQMDLN
jgi:hypothetical protein